MLQQAIAPNWTWPGVQCLFFLSSIAHTKQVTAQQMQGDKADGELCCDLLQVLATELFNLWNLKNHSGLPYYILKSNKKFQLLHEQIREREVNYFGGKYNFSVSDGCWKQWQLMSLVLYSCTGSLTCEFTRHISALAVGVWISRRWQLLLMEKNKIFWMKKLLEEEKKN